MQNILQELYDGEIRPCEGHFPKSYGYKESLEEFRQLEDKLLSRLNQEEQELYNQLSIVSLKRGRYEDIQAFSDAFHLGMNLMMACLLESEAE